MFQTSLAAALPSAPQAASQQQTAPAAQAYAWDGRWRQDNDVEVISHPPDQRGDPGQVAREMREELQAILEAQAIDRDAERTLAALEVLRAKAAWNVAYQGQSEVLGEVAQQRAALLTTLGRAGEAERAQAEWLPTSASCTASYGELAMVPARPELVEAVREAQALRQSQRALEAGAAARAQLGGAALETRALDEKNLAQVVRIALKDGRVDILESIGAMAAPTLASEVEADLGAAFRSSREDPLHALMVIDEERAMELVMRHLELALPAWRLRVLKCMRDAELVQRVDNWALDVAAGQATEVPPQFLSRKCREVFEAWIEDPPLSGEIVPLVIYLAERDALGPHLLAKLSSALELGDRSRVDLPMRIAGLASGQPALLEIVLSGLGSPLRDVRDVCAARLEAYAARPELRSLVDNPHPEVRANLAVALAPGLQRALRYYLDDNGVSLGSDFERAKSLGAPDQVRAMLQTLLLDSDRGVRQCAGGSVLAYNSPGSPGMAIDAPTFQALIRASNADQRQWALRLADYAPRGEWPGLAKLASLPDAEVMAALDAFLVRNIRVIKNQKWLHGILLARLENRGVPLTDAEIEGRSLGEFAAHEPDSMFVPLTQQALERGDDQEWLRSLLQAAPACNATYPDISFDGLPPPLMAQALLAVEALGVGRNWRYFRERFEQRADALDPGMRLVAADPAAGPISKLVAIHVLSRSRVDGSAQLAVEAIAGLREEPQGEWSSLLPSIGAELCRQDGGVLLIRLIEDARVPLNIRQGVLWGISFGGPCDQDFLVRAFRVIGNESVDAAVQIVSNLSRVVDDEDARELRAIAAHSQHSNLRQAAIQYFGRTRHPQWFDWLVELLNSSGSGRELDTVTAMEAATGIANYMDQRSADVLLEAAGRTPNRELREHILQRLADLRGYQEQLAFWKRRQHESTAWEQAVLELTRMLADPDPQLRAQAAESLGKLGAVKHMADLVGLLKDADPAVRAAARQALEQLNTRIDQRSVAPQGAETAPAPPPTAPTKPKGDV